MSNVIDLCNNENEKNVSEAVNNVCLLKYHSQKENNETMCSDSELEDTTEDYSIIADKYSITPGKQRLFDLRSAKPSFHTKSCSVSVPFMDRIEETTSPIVPKNLNSHSVLNNVSYIPSDTKENLEAPSVNDICCSSSAINFSCLNDIMPDSNVKNFIDSTNKLIVIDKEVELTDISVEDKRILDTSNSIINQGSTNKTMNIMAESLIYQNHVGDEKKPVAVEVETKLVNTSVVNTMSNDLCTNTVLRKNENIQFNKSLNNPNICVNNFDNEKSTNLMSNTIVATIDHENVEKSETLAMEIESINSSVTDVSDDIIYTNKLSTNSESIKFNKSLIEANQSEYLSHTVKFDLEESVITKPKFIFPAINDKKILLSEKNATNTDVNCSEKPSSIITQYLNFNQSQIEKFNDISSANINSTLNELEDNQSKNNQFQNNISVIEQTVCSETTDLENKDNSYSIFGDDHLESKLSVIIENRTLEEEIMVQNDDAEKVVENMSSNSISKNVLTEDTNNEMLIKLAKDSIKEVINHVECDSTIHEVGPSLINETYPLENVTEIENNFTDQSVSNSGISIIKNNDIIDNCFLSKNDGVSQNETNLITEVENQVVNYTTDEQILSKDIEKNDWSLNSFSKNNLTDISIFNTSELLLRSESALKNIHQDHVFDITNSMSNSLAEFKKIEQMFLDEDKKVFEFKTPKTQKLLDFSVEQQSRFLVSQEKKQKLLNFSIVDQTPTLNSIQHKSFNHTSKKVDTLMDFSSVNQLLDLEIMSTDEIDFQESSSNNLINISEPNVELLSNESIKTSSSDHSDLSFNQTITETNLNKPENSMNQLKVNDMEQFSKKKDSIVLINKQIEVNESSNFLNKIIAQNKSCDELNIEEITSKEHKHEPEHVLSTTLNTESVIDSYQKLPNKYYIQDFSIVENSSKLKNIETITSVKSDNNASNLIDMSVRPICSSYKSFVSSNIPLIVVSSHDESEKTLNSCSSDCANNTAIYFEDSQHFNKENLTDVQMNDVSLVESPDKGSVSELFYSIESEHLVQEDKKRKIEPLQESQIIEKKMKVDAEELKTPSSMLYKIRNMFRSSEKKLHSSSYPDENNLKSNIPCQKLNFNKCEENKATFAKPSKIPCKVTDISMTKSSEFNLSTSSLNDNIVKPKKTNPKLTGLPVLTDVSNSSKKKFPESRIPSKFQK